MASPPDWLEAAREHWSWRGQARPPFATAPGPGQVSVWDFLRPPRLAAEPREVVVAWDGMEVARTQHAMLVLETSHPPSVYLPWADVRRDLLQSAAGASFCEWKGPARYWSLVDGTRRSWSGPSRVRRAAKAGSAGNNGRLTRPLQPPAQATPALAAEV